MISVFTSSSLNLFKNTFDLAFFLLIIQHLSTKMNIYYVQLFLDAVGAWRLWLFSYWLLVTLELKFIILDKNKSSVYKSKMEMQEWQNSRIRAQLRLICFFKQWRTMIFCICHHVCLCNFYLFIETFTCSCLISLELSIVFSKCLLPVASETANT